MRAIHQARWSGLGGLAVLAVASLAHAGGGIPPVYDQPLRPQFHYSPQQNWMNDPNGLVYHDGEYHLFYQYNPQGDTWGNMSWGHAVSRDLLHWEELPVALRADDEQMFFSGSAVVDHANTTGFGSPGNPPMVAVYTRFDRETAIQSQAIAYSLDNGRTWTEYAGNPVIDIDSTEFRDPKVFWYEPEERWIMAVVLAEQHKVRFYGSPDLKQWTHLSDFGPANATGGVWEVPDLFQLPVDGDPNHKKWVLVVNLNPGSIAGGSGAQYFVGEFDGRAFHAENVVTDYEAPPGRAIETFEAPNYGDWTATGEAFSDGPAAGALAGQLPVDGYQGERLANSFHGGDAATGTLTSPPFSITRDHINLLVGGGNHPYVPGTSDGGPPSGHVVADFEADTYAAWTTTGTAFGSGPVRGTFEEGPGQPRQNPVTQYLGERLVNSYRGGDDPTGTLTSPTFTLDRPYLNFLVGGGSHDGTAVRLRVDGEVVRSASGRDDEALDWVAWNIGDYLGRSARIEIVDEVSSGWGHINADHFVLADRPAQPLARDTSVNLLVDGEIVRSATGADSESLDWRSWNVEAFDGRQARIQIRDRNTGGWGHLLVDQIEQSDHRALSPLERYDWVDYGKDFYAAISYENLPSDRRIVVGWLNNWQYANRIPTSPWRSAQSLPRSLSLVTADNGDIQLRQQPVREYRRLRTGAHFAANDRRVPAGVHELDSPRAVGRVAEIVAEFEPGNADEFGLQVLKGEDEATLVGYDVHREQAFVDRREAGESSFSDAFAGRHAGPLPLTDGRVRLHAFVDRSAVELFAGDGRTVVTDRVFPTEHGDGLAIYARGGSARLVRLSVWPLKSSWQQ